MPTAQVWNEIAKEDNVKVPDEVSLRAVHRLDGHGRSGLTIVFSDHLGIKKIFPFARQGRMMFARMGAKTLRIG
jgi:hypothetical protein